MSRARAAQGDRPLFGVASFVVPLLLVACSSHPGAEPAIDGGHADSGHADADAGPPSDGGACRTEERLAYTSVGCGSAAPAPVCLSQITRAARAGVTRSLRSGSAAPRRCRAS